MSGDGFVDLLRESDAERWVAAERAERERAEYLRADDEIDAWAAREAAGIAGRTDLDQEFVAVQTVSDDLAIARCERFVSDDGLEFEPHGSTVAAMERKQSYDEPRVVTLEEFIAVDELGAEALVGDEERGALIPEGGDVMFYGDGGAGKTTLCIDLAYHLAAGDTWLGMRVNRPLRVLIIENEGPRPLFRKKLKRKAEAWTGSPIEGRISVFAEPWATLSLDHARFREMLAEDVRHHEIDVVILGPVTRSGMNEAGTLQQVVEFCLLIKQVRDLSERSRLAFLLVHHENKGGQVSGAWEGSGDTLFHVQGQGNGHTRLYVQKARWASFYHGTTLHLAWTDGDGFTVAEKEEATDSEIVDGLLQAARQHPGGSWNKIVSGVSGAVERKAAVRDRLLRDGLLVNRASGKKFELWAADDPALLDDPFDLLK